jgi:hypothetical protein
VRLTGLPLRGASVDLMQGDHLVELSSPTCRHCLGEAPRLNQWVSAPGLPPLVTLHG